MSDAATLPVSVLVAPQAFKGSLDAARVADAIATGIRLGWPDALPPHVTLLPLADGGEGTVHALTADGRGTRSLRVATGPLPGEQVTAEIGWLGGENPTAIVEMAQAAGLPLIAPDARDPLRATTYGVGELLRAALDAGARRIYVGLGGSATNDGGAGMAQALGVRLLDGDDQDLPPGGAALAALARIDLAALDPRLAATEIIGLTDVTNPLCGPEGASAVYGPQKGATPAQLAQLDAALAHYAAIIARDMGCAVAEVPGAGAAGGMGAGLLAFGGPHTRLVGGATTVLNLLDIDARLDHTHLVFTGEGRLDAQVVYGKLTSALAKRAHVRGIPVLCVVGGLAAGYEAAYDLGISAVIVAADGPRSLADAMTHTHDLIAGSVARALRLWRMPPLERS